MMTPVITGKIGIEPEGLNARKEIGKVSGQ